jgi:hypothetical protein
MSTPEASRKQEDKYGGNGGTGGIQTTANAG